MEDLLGAARAACRESRWGDAFRAFELVDASGLDVDDLDAYATAAYLTGRAELGFAMWTRAHQACADDGRVHRAAQLGSRLAECYGFGGDVARLGGWADRTARLLGAAGIDCVEQGYLAHALGMATLFADGDLAGALERFQSAGKTADRYGNRELRALAAIGEGRMLVYLGDVATGLALLDEAMVAIEAGELSPIATGDAYCTVIDACAELSDVVRCRAWTSSMRRWCDEQQELVLYRGHCFVHSAEVLRVLGRWSEALEEARRACDRLAVPVPSALGAAVCLEADLLRSMGDLEGAAAGYARATELGHQPQPGLALLALARGDLQGAAATVERALAECEGPVFRARLLPAAFAISRRSGDAARAGALATELRETSAELRSSYLGGHAALAAGSVALDLGDPGSALAELRRACRVFTRLDAREDLAGTRLLLAQAFRALGDVAGAELEEAAAHAAEHSFREPADGEEQLHDLPGGLTPRELDVLRALASGSTNRVIGAELFITEKTVATHVSHIFTKLGVTSRAAATAYAYDRGLL